MVRSVLPLQNAEIFSSVSSLNTTEALQYTSPETRDSRSVASRSSHSDVTSMILAIAEWIGSDLNGSL